MPMLALSIVLVCLFILIVSTYTDIKTLEVPDWLTYGGIAAGLGIHLIFSVQQWQWWPVASSIIGLAAGFAIAALMFYTGQWGGGDAKLLMAMGALIGFEFDKLSFGASFMINLIMIGAAWGFIWTLGLAIKNYKRFSKTFNAIRQHKPYARLRGMTIITVSVLLVAAVLLTTVRTEFVLLAAASYLLCHLTIFIKSAELSCMHKWVSPDKLTEGDWLVHAIKVGKVTIEPGKLGLEKKDLAAIQKLHKQKKLDNVLVKYGVPFVPAFLLAFLITLAYNNLLFTLITGGV